MSPLFSQSPTHTPLTTKESYSSDTESLLSSDDHTSPPPRRKPTRLRLTLILLATHLLTAILFAWAGSRYWRTSFDPNAFCSRHTSHYSPVVNEVAIKYETVTYNGSFFHQTAYRGDAGPETDKAWEDLGVDYRAMAVPAEDALKSGIAKDQVRIREKYGGGYPANVEGLHHLHCLNLLRQSLYYNFDYYKKLGRGAFKNEDHIVKAHVTHCLDILRQQLMCTVDTGLLGQVWWNPEAPAAFVDFNTEHKCKNYDAIRAWAEKRQLPPPEQGPPDLLEPPKPGVDTILDEIP